MPPAVGTAIAGLAAGGAAVYGAKKQASAADKAAIAQTKANDEALAYQKEQDAKAEARQAEIDARQREIEAKAEAAWNAEQARLAPLRALKQSLADATAGRMGLQMDLSGISDAKPYSPGASGSVSPLSTLSSLSGTGTRASSAALPDTTGLSEEDPYTTSAVRLADIARGGWRL